MAGDWIKVEMEAPDKPEVMYIAGILKVDPDAVFGKLFRVWSWFDKHTENGNALGVTYSLVDRITGVTGFAEAMALAGWLKQDGASLILPNFDRHNGKTAKNRALGAKRVAKSRSSDEKSNDVIVTKSLPEKRREEKRREEEKDSLGFASFWAEYPRKTSKAAAEKAWTKLNPDSALQAKVLAAVEMQRRSEQWVRDGGQYIPHASTWLNGRRWEDEARQEPQSDFVKSCSPPAW